MSRVALSSAHLTLSMPQFYTWNCSRHCARMLTLIWPLYMLPQARHCSLTAGAIVRDRAGRLLPGVLHQDVTSTAYTSTMQPHSCLDDWHLLRLTHSLADKVTVKHVGMSIEGFKPHMVRVGYVLASWHVLEQHTQQLRYWRCT